MAELLNHLFGITKSQSARKDKSGKVQQKSVLNRFIILAIERSQEENIYGADLPQLLDP